MKLEIRNPASSLYGGNSGNFATHLRTFQSCRVTFHKDYESWVLDYQHTVGHPEFKNFFYIPLSISQNHQMIAYRVQELEDRLDLIAKNRFELWQEANALVCKPSAWWLDPVRFHFFTAFLREARETWEKTIKGCSYFPHTQDAIEKFLAGNVFYHGHTFHGWVEQFQAKLSLTTADTGRENRLSLLKDFPAEHDTIQVKHYYAWKYHDNKKLEKSRIFTNKANQTP